MRWERLWIVFQNFAPRKYAGVSEDNEVGKQGESAYYYTIDWIWSLEILPQIKIQDILYVIRESTRPTLL